MLMSGGLGGHGTLPPLSTPLASITDKASH